MNLTLKDLEAIGNLIDHKLEEKLDEKLSPILKDLKILRKDTSYIIDALLDRELMHQDKRIDKIERHLGWKVSESKTKYSKTAK